MIFRARQWNPSRGNKRARADARSTFGHFRPALERLEDRLVPASSITIIPGTTGAGSLDGFLSAADGTIATADGGAVAGTISSGALAAIGANVDINITATDSITFNDLGGTLTLQTG